MLITTVALARDTAVTDRGNVVIQLPRSTSLFGFSTLSVTNLGEAPQLYLKFHTSRIYQPRNTNFGSRALSVTLKQLVHVLYKTVPSSLPVYFVR